MHPQLSNIIAQQRAAQITDAARRPQPRAGEQPAPRQAPILPVVAPRPRARLRLRRSAG